MKKNVSLILFLLVFTAGCTPQAAPAAPTLDINIIAGTMMAATLTAVAPTPVPPTSTPPPEPSATPVPAGTLLENFDASFVYPKPDTWSDPFDVSQLKHNYRVSSDQNYLNYEFSDPEIYLYTFYQKEMPADVKVETSYKNTDTQSMEASVVCRMDQVSRTKWYEFRIIHFERAGVIYYFDRKDVYNNPYKRLAYAKLPVELFRDRENRLEGVCKGNKLTLFLNGQEVTSAEDNTLTGPGLVGIGGVSHGKLPLLISFNYLKVQKPE